MTDLPRGAQRREIEFNRAILNIRPVLLHDMPKWWMSRVCWASHGWGSYAAQCGIEEIEARFPPGLPRLFDHWGSSMMSLSEGLTVSTFVMEPYFYAERRTDFQLAANLMAISAGCHVTMLPPDHSFWYPNHTVRIEFFECPENPPC